VTLRWETRITAIPRVSNTVGSEFRSIAVEELREEEDVLRKLMDPAYGNWRSDDG
jgi:hypothetical protein